MSPYRRTLVRIVLFSAPIIVGAFLFATASVGKSSLAQAFLDDFNVITQTTVTVTVILADGQTVAVPVELNYTFQHRNGLGYTYLDASAEQPSNAVAAIQNSNYISAAIEAIVYRDNPTPIAVSPPTSVPPTSTPMIIVSTPTPVPGYTEILTVGDWISATEDHRRAMTVIWSQEYHDMGIVTDDPVVFGGELFDCINEVVGRSSSTMGLNFAIEEVVASCTLLLIEE